MVNSIRVTIDKELFDIIVKQAESMNKVCYGVLDTDVKKGNTIFKEASKIIAKKYKGII
jgi:hypothetical protein